MPSLASKLSSSDLIKEFNLHPIISQILVKRNIATPDALERFLKPNSGHFREPLLMKGMQEVVTEIQKVRAANGTVLLHGDYDADGISSTALISKVFNRLGIRHFTFLPQRAKHGYGLSEEGVEEAKKRDAQLLMSLDCGISSVEEVKKAKASGLQVVLVDHHQMKNELPPADAILHPLSAGTHYPFKDFSAAGLSYKIAQAFLGKGALELLELAALGTVADLAPLLDENRTLVRGGLKRLTEDPSLAFRELKRAASLHSAKINAGHIGFIFAPRINASGRLGTAEPSLELLLTDSYERASQLATQLDTQNRERQRIEKEMVQRALQKAEIEFNWTRDKVFFLWDETWHPGVAGIVASRLVEKFARPALVAAVEQGLAKGSGRSIRGFNLFALLDRHREIFESFGGHEQAVGFTVTVDKLESLRKKLQETAAEFLEGADFLSPFEVDQEISFRVMEDQFFSSLEKLEPFGIGNPRPVFLSRGLTVKTPPISRGEGLKFLVEERGTNRAFEVFWPRAEGKSLSKGELIDLVFSVETNNFRGESYLTLKAKQIQKRKEG